jgi:subtilisin family serine protease
MRRKCYTFTLILLVSLSLLTIVSDKQRETNNNIEYNEKTRNASELSEIRENHAVSYINGDTEEKFQQQPFAISDSSKIDNSLRNYDEIREKGYIQDGELRVIVLPSRKKEMNILEPLTTTEISDLSSSIQKFKATIVNTCEQLPFITIKLPYENMFELSRQSFIAYMSLDTKHYVCLDESVSIIKPPGTWHQIEVRHGHEINGSGIKIAILDTGIDKTHLDLDDLDDDPQTIDCKVIAEKCFTDESRTADGYGHGTHCAGIAAGTGQASNYIYVGVAPAAQLLNGKVLTDEGWGYSSWIIGGIEWAVAEGADIISMSFGLCENTDGTDPLSTAANWATDQGSTCVVAAGNEGSNGMFSIGTPGCSSYAITVGATDKADRLASFSSLGYTADFRVKPDILAPGVDIISCRAHGTSMGTIVDANYTRSSGTSMATPHISGLCALVLQIHLDWNPKTVKYSILDGAVDLGYHTYEQGSGRANICNSLSMPLVVSSPISFKRVRLFEAYSQNVTLRNVNGTPVDALLNAYIKTMNGTGLDFISVSEENVVLDINQMVTIQVTVNFPDCIEGFFEGNLTVTSETDVIRIPLATAVLSSLSLICQDEQGRKVKDLKWQLYDSISYEQLESTCNPSPTFFVKQGTYTVVAYSMIIFTANEVDYEGAFLLYKNVTVPMGSDVSANIPLNFGKRIEIQLFCAVKCYAKMIKDYGYYGVERTLQHPYVYLSNMCSLVHLQKPVFSFYGSLAESDWMDKWNMPEKLLPYSFDTCFCRWNLEQVMTDMPDQLVLRQVDFADYMIEISNCNKFPDYYTYVWFNCFTDQFGTGLWSGFITFPGAHWRCYVQPIEGADNLPLSHWGFALSPELHEYSYFILRKPTEGEKKNFKVGYVPSLPQQLAEDDDQIILQCPLRGWENTQYVETEGHYRLEIFKNNDLIGNQSIEWQREVYFSNYMETHGSGQYDYRVSAKTSQNISRENLIEYQILYDSSKLLSEQDILPPTIDCINCSVFQVGKTQEFTLKVNDNSGVKNVSVWFKPDNGNWNEVFLENKGRGIYSMNMTVTDSNIHSVSLRINVMDVNGNTINYETAPCTMKGIETTLYIQHPDQCEPNESITVCGNLTTSNGKLRTPVYVSVFLNEESYIVLTNYFVETEEYNGEFVFRFIVSQDTCIRIVFQGFYVYPSISDEGHVSVLLHDIAILAITPTATHVYQGDSLNITIIVQNQGNFVESFNVILYANSSVVENATIINLPPGGQMSLTSTWNVENVTLGEYALHGHMTIVAGEIDISDNTYTDGTIEVVIFNVDFDGDGVVNALDLRIAAIHFGQAGSSLYDLNFDNIVNLDDLQVITENFGKAA